MALGTKNCMKIEKGNVNLVFSFIFAKFSFIIESYNFEIFKL